MPHIPLYVPDEVRDPNPQNAYTNTIEHIDSEVGRLLNVLDELNLAKSTYVIYTTDNGPWLPYLHHGGSAGPSREGKGTTFEGGQRVPCVMRRSGNSCRFFFLRINWNYRFTPLFHRSWMLRFLTQKSME